MFQNYAISPSLQCHCPNFCSQVIYAALEDVQMSVKRCAIEVLGKLDLPPDSQAVGCLGCLGSRFRSSRNWTTKCPTNWRVWDDSDDKFGDSYISSMNLIAGGGVNHFDPQPNGSCRWVHILTVAASIFQLLGGGSAWVCAETVGQPGEMMQFTFVDFAKLDFVEWKHCRASKMVRYFGLVFAINWGTFDIVWGAKSRIIHIRTYMYVIHK